MLQKMKMMMMVMGHGQGEGLEVPRGDVPVMWILGCSIEWEKNRGGELELLNGRGRAGRLKDRLLD